MFQFAKLNSPVLADRTYASLNLIFFVNHLSCASHITCSHTHTFVAHFECIHIGGALLNFLENVQNGISMPNLNSIQYAHI
jgi:hypothetical protein